MKSPRPTSTAALLTLRPAGALACLALVCILAATLMPVGPKNELLSPFPAYLHMDKVGHFVGFALLGGALRLTGRMGAWMALAAAVLLGVLTEALQFLADGRIGRLADVLIDGAGAALGVAVAVALVRLGLAAGQRRGLRR